VSDGESSHHSCSSLESSPAVPFEVKVENVNIRLSSEVEHSVVYDTVIYHFFDMLTVFCMMFVLYPVPNTHYLFW